MIRPARPSSRILGCLLALLLLAQLGFMGVVQATPFQWLEICSAGGTSWVPVADPDAAVPGHEDSSHCPACPIGQPAALFAAPPVALFQAQCAGTVPPCPAPLLRAGPRWRPSLPRGPPLPS